MPSHTLVRPHTHTCKAPESDREWAQGGECVQAQIPPSRRPLPHQGNWSSTQSYCKERHASLRTSRVGVLPQVRSSLAEAECRQAATQGSEKPEREREREKEGGLVLCVCAPQCQPPALSPSPICRLMSTGTSEPHSSAGPCKRGGSTRLTRVSFWPPVAVLTQAGASDIICCSSALWVSANRGPSRGGWRGEKRAWSTSLRAEGHGGRRCLLLRLTRKDKRKCRIDHKACG